MDPTKSNVHFNDVFDQWAVQYDDTVTKENGEYADVFYRYECILEKTVDGIGLAAGARVIDVGAGTGNLTQVAHEKGYDVVGIEPNGPMRKAARHKFPHLRFFNGHFLGLPKECQSASALISSYAFHHLTTDEKARAACTFRSMLPGWGKVIIADTMFESEQAYKDAWQTARRTGKHNLADDLMREYYPLTLKMQTIFSNAGFSVTFEKMNAFVYIMTATCVKTDVMTG